MKQTSAQKELLQRARLLLTWYEDIESPDSEATDYASWLTLRVILQQLPPLKRKQFTSLLNTDPQKAYTLAESTIPDLKNRITLELAKGMDKAFKEVSRKV